MPNIRKANKAGKVKQYTNASAKRISVPHNRSIEREMLADEVYDIIFSGRIVVGSSAQVAANVANYDSIQDAIDEAPDGAEIYILKGTYTEALTLPNTKSVKLNGQGFGTVVDGTITVTGDYHILNWFKVEDVITLNGGGNFGRVWVATGKYPVDNGAGNDLTFIEE